MHGKLNKVCLNSHPEARFWCILIKTLQLIYGSVDLVDSHILMSPVTSKLTDYLLCMCPTKLTFPFFCELCTVQLISLDLESSVESVWFVCVARCNAINLQCTNHTLLTACSKSSEINCTYSSNLLQP